MKNSLLIIGGGPSGLTAALYGLRSKLDVVLIEKYAPGGQLLKTESIENYPGFPSGISGIELATNFFEQISHFPNFKYVTDEIKEISKENNFFKLKSLSETYTGSALVIATGGSSKHLSIPGEEEFLGKGVSYCGICDGFFFKGKTVAIVGGGDTALEDAIYLNNIAKKVYLIHRRNTFRGSPDLFDKVKSSSVEIIYDTIPLEIKGIKQVDTLVINTKGIVKELKVQGVFVAIGQEFDSSILPSNINLSNNNIIVNENMETNIPGLFAAGDIVKKSLRQVSTAVGDGAKAGQGSFNYLNLLNNKE